MMRNICFAFGALLVFVLSVECGMVGNPKTVNITHPRLVNVSEVAVRITSSSNGSPCPEGFVLQAATQQVVSGMKYKLTYKIQPENCPENSKGNLESGKECQISVWSQPWTQKEPVITDNTCVLGSDSKTASSVTSTDGTKKPIIGGGDHDIGHMGMFKDFVKKYNKLYLNQKEYNKRFKIFRMNMKKVRKLQETDTGTAIYGPTQFADLTEEEFKRNHLGLKPKMRASNRKLQLAKTPTGPIPDSFDWRDRKVVTPVKNQGMCGSCWAFSVTGNVEGQWAIKNNTLLSLSEQELVDCDKLDSGCEGGEMTNAYEQIIQLGGLETEDDYPYDGEDEKCSFSRSKAKVTIQSYVNISQDETEMAQWLYSNGPISIGINANVMQFYFGGISHPWKIFCNPASLDHGVLIVGYGQTIQPRTKKVIPFWIIKNSWSDSWGEDGYYRVYRGDGTCGLNLMATSAIV